MSLTPVFDPKALRDLLQKRNQFLLRELDTLADALHSTQISPLLLPFADRLNNLAQLSRSRAERNLEDLALQSDEILNEVLSNTSGASSLCRLLGQRMVAPVLRASSDDEAALRLILWMHGKHPRTGTIPAACATGDAAIWPIVDMAPVYFFPCLEGRGLLYLSLFFHEFGHLLYALYKRELDDLIKEWQGALENYLQPISGRNDRRAEAQIERLRVIVPRWYEWTIELFCDAVGLQIGGPAYLLALSSYIGKMGRGDFSKEAHELAKSDHPVNWLRVQLLAKRARALGWSEAAQKVESEWSHVARTLGVQEDYQGYFETAWTTRLDGILSDMLTGVELEPSAPAFEMEHSVFERDWKRGDCPVALLNQAWREVQARPAADYSAWERNARSEFLNSCS